MNININKRMRGLGIGDWGLVIGDWGLDPIPNPQSPIPNPHLIFINIKNYFKLIFIKYYYYSFFFDLNFNI